jgi:hypothetical protein
VGLFKAVLIGTMFGTINENAIHFSKEPVAWPNDGTAFLTELRDNFIGGANGIRNRLTSAQKWTRIDLYNLQLPGEGPVSLSVNIVGARTGNLTQAFAHNTVLIHKKAFAGGRRGRGRMYLSGIDPATWNSGIMTQAEQDLWAPIIANLMARYGSPGASSGWTMMVAGHGDSGNDAGHSVKALTLSSTPGTQRRRNIGVGI